MMKYAHILKSMFLMQFKENNTWQPACSKEFLLAIYQNTNSTGVLGV